MPLQRDYREAVKVMVETAPPDAVFLLDSRIALPGLHDSSDVERHLLRLREIAPASLDTVPDDTVPEPASVERAGTGAHPRGRTAVSNSTLRRIIVAALGLILLATPLLVRSAFLGYNRRPYAPAAVSDFSVAVTPAPTVTPIAAIPMTAQVTQELRPGPVVVDLAHGNRISRSQFESLSAVLGPARPGLAFLDERRRPHDHHQLLRLPGPVGDVDVAARDASALVVASPFFLWSKPEIAVVERFVADGGRLLLISDPDVVGDLAQDINNLAEPFGIVFADDYLYDTVQNDGNHVYVFQTQFEDQAADLTGSRIAFYGARSISGEITPQIRTADTTLSALREGRTGLTTAATGGLASRGTLGNVLALTDIDVMTTPFIQRYDNARIAQFVADFLAAGQRTNAVMDFPAYLGRHVTLIFANASAVDGPILLEGSRLQKSLEATGRSLSLGGTALLTATLEANSETSPRGFDCSSRLCDGERAEHASHRPGLHAGRSVPHPNCRG